MRIDLSDFATMVADNYEDVTLDFGHSRTLEVRVYQPPQPVLWGVRPDEAPPELPLIEMKTATGRVQRRPATPNDGEIWSDYNSKRLRWQRKADDLIEDAILVHALRDVDYPDLSQPPQYLTAFVNGHYPTHEIARKAFWLRATLLARAANYNAVRMAIYRLTAGVDAEVVDDIKKNSGSELTDDPLADEVAEAISET